MFVRRIFRVLMVTAATVPIAGAAVAQMYPGQDVIVNPDAIPHSQLLAPGQPYPGLRLRPPSAHRRHHHAAAKASAPAESATASAGTSAPADGSSSPAALPPKPKHTARVTEGTTTSSTSANSVPFSLGEDEPLGAPAAPSPEKPAKPAPAQVAKTEPPPAQSAPPDKSDASQGGLAKRGAILFEHSATDPQPSQLDGIKLLAGDLNSALEAGATQIQLQAFGGAPGDKSSDARRISLKRALAIRQLLIDNGVPASRIVTRAMGGVTDNGSPDRVDIYIRSI